RPDVLGAAGGARAGGADHAPPRADTRRALASGTPAGAPGSLRQGLERLTMQRARTLAVITATLVLVSAAHADAAAGNEHAETRARVAWEALHKAQESAARASAVEQALIDALAARYPAPQPPAAAQSDAVLSAYAAAMRSVAERFPDDLDVQTLCAESEMNVHAWKLWTADGQPVAGTLQIEKRLESVLQRSPGHPGANHYYIHVMEASPAPGKALASAERLRGMMPSAGYLEHMPAHIMQRLGRYEEAAEANRRGVAADQAYLRATTAPD